MSNPRRFSRRSDSSYSDGVRKFLPEQRVDRLVFRVHVDQPRVLVAEHELEQPVLPGLEARALSERIAKPHVVRGRHRAEHVPGLDQLRLHARDAREHLECRLEVIGADLRARRREFVQAELDPQLARLVDDDEQHLVVLARHQLLRVQHLVELQVLAVADRLVEIPVDPGHRVGGLAVALVVHSASGWASGRVVAKAGSVIRCASIATSAGYGFRSR